MFAHVDVHAGTRTISVRQVALTQSKEGCLSSLVRNEFMLPNVFRLSRWVFVYSKGDVIALYHSLNVKVMFVSNAYAWAVSKLRCGTTELNLVKQSSEDAGEIQGLIKELDREGYVVSVDDNDDIVFEKKRTQHLLQPGLETLYLLLTDDCNLRCTYCFILDGVPKGHRHRVMDEETAKKAVDIYFLNIRNNPPQYRNTRKVINFYGGEPLLNFSVLKRVIEYVEDKYREEIAELGDLFLFSLITNGTLITEEVAEYVASKQNIAVTVSLDGFSEVNDMRRMHKSGRGSYEEAENGLRELKRAGCHTVSLSCTIDRHNMDRLDDLLELRKEYQFVSVNLNPLLDTESRIVDSDYLSIVNTKDFEYFEKAREQGVYEERMMRKVKPFLSGRIHAYDCQATGHQLVCSPDGRLGVCQEGVGSDHFFFSSVDSDFSFHENKTILEWNSRSPLNMPQCKNCEAIGICGGGCAYGAELRNGSIWSLDDRFCSHSLQSLEWLIWDLYKHVSSRASETSRVDQEKAQQENPSDPKTATRFSVG